MLVSKCDEQRLLFNSSPNINLLNGLTNPIKLGGVTVSLYSLLGFLSAFLVFFFIIVLVLYVLLSYGLYKLALGRKMQNEWLAFVPIAQLYLLGKLIKKVTIFNNDIPCIEVVLPVSAVVTGVLAGIPVLGLLLSLAFAVLVYVSFYRLFRMYKSKEEADVMIIVSIVSIVLFGFMLPVYVFLMKDSKPREA